MSGSFDPGLIPLYTTQFSTNLELLLQQQGSLLRGRVRARTFGWLLRRGHRLGVVEGL